MAILLPFFYSLFYRIFGHTYWPIAILNCCLSVVIMVFTMLLAEFWFGVDIAIYTGWILALWPALIQYTSVLASELIFMALIMATLWCWLTQSLRWYWQGIVTGLLLATATYVRTTSAVIPLILGFSSLVRFPREYLKIAKSTILSTILIVIVIAPWSYRNTIAFGQFTTVATNSGTNLWMGNNPMSKGGYTPLPSEVENMNEAQRNDYLKDKAIEYIKQFPLLYLERSAQRAIDTYNRQSISIEWNRKTLERIYGESIMTSLKLLNQIYWVAVLASSFYGLFWFVKRSGFWSALTHPIILFWAYFSVICIFIVSGDRYLYPALTFIAIMSAYGLFQLRAVNYHSSSRSER